MTANTNPTERVAYLAFLPPLANTSARNTDFVDVSKYKRIRATFMAGVSEAAGTFLLRRASAAAGTGAENASATVAWGGASTTGDNVTTVLEFFPEDYITAAKPFLGLQSAATAGSLTSVLIEGFDPRYAPASADNADDVVIAANPAVA